MRRISTTTYKNQCQGELLNGTLASLPIKSKKSGCPTPGPQVLFFFMERFSNSRSWRSAMKLAASNKWFDEQNIVVILVGDYEHLLPATRLAAEMGLPFLLLADHDGALWRRYGRCEFNSRQRKDAYVLVDFCGQVQYSVQDQRFGLMPVTDQLISSMKGPH